MWLSKITLASITIVIASFGAIAQDARTPAPDGAEVYIISPEDGASVTSPVTVKFGLKGMGVAPSGVDVHDTGHHHLLIDVEELPPLDKEVPANEHHRHFGGGETQAEIDLEPGQHTLQLILADASHIPHDPPVISERITITVE